MSAQEETQVNDAPQEQQQRTVSAQAVLLSAIDLAQSRGAYKVTEMSLITQAYNMIAAEEQKRNAPVEAAEDNSAENKSE